MHALHGMSRTIDWSLCLSGDKIVSFVCHPYNLIRFVEFP